MVTIVTSMRIVSTPPDLLTAFVVEDMREMDKTAQTWTSVRRWGVQLDYHYWLTWLISFPFQLTNVCGEFGSCVNVMGSFKCECQVGYSCTSDSPKCQSINSVSVELCNSGFDNCNFSLRTLWIFTLSNGPPMLFEQQQCHWPWMCLRLALLDRPVADWIDLHSKSPIFFESYGDGYWCLSAASHSWIRLQWRM